MRILGSIRQSPRLVFAALTVLVILLGTVFAANLSHATPVPAPAESSPAEQELTLRLAADKPYMPASVDSIKISFEAINTAAEKLESKSLSFYFSPNRVNSLDDLAARLDITKLPTGIGSPFATATFGDVGSQSAKSVSVTLSSTDIQLPTPNAAGVYLVIARLVTADASEHFVATPIVWQGTGSSAPTPVHTVVPLVFPTDIDGMPSAGQLSALTSPGGLLSDNLDTAEQRGSTLAIDPRIVAATRALGEKAPESAIAFLSRLEASPNPKFALQYADADLSAQAQLGLEQPLQPAGFTFVSGQTLREDFTAFNYSLTGIAWPRASTVTGDALEFMTASGYNTVFLDTSNLKGVSGSSAPLGSQRVVAFDSRLQATAARALTGTTSLSRNAASGELVAQLALLNESTEAGVPVNLGLDREGAAERKVAPLLTLISTLPWMTPTSFDAVLSQSGSATLVDTPLPAERLDDLASALEAEPKIDAYAEVLTHPRYLSELQRLRVLEYFATSVGLSTPGYADTTAAYFERDAQTLRGVRVTTTTTANLLGTESKIPIQITNDLPFSARVKGTAAASNGSLIVTEPKIKKTTISPNSRVTVTIPVKARVSAGQSMLIVDILTADGKTVDNAAVPVEIRSSVEAVTLTVLAILVVAFFGFGTVRSLRRKRSQSFTEESEHSEK